MSCMERKKCRSIFTPRTVKSSRGQGERLRTVKAHFGEATQTTLDFYIASHETFQEIQREVVKVTHEDKVIWQR